MLYHIHVKNMALIQEAEIDLGPGLNILTGETGAGKSIIIGSITVALGIRGFRGLVRDEAKEALIELIFLAKDQNLKIQLKALEISTEDDQVIISRRLQNGRSISKINGETVPAAKVRQAAELLLDIYGQHEHQSLLHIKNHLLILDQFAGDKLQTYLQSNAAIYKEYLGLKKELEQLQTDETARAKEIDFLEYEVGEIEQAQLRKGEDQELESQYIRLSNARQIIEGASEMYRMSGYEQNGAGEMIGRAVRELSKIQKYDQKLIELLEQLEDIDNLLNDFNREAADYMSGLTLDEESFAIVAERLDLYNHLKAKYGNTVEEIFAYKSEKEERLTLLNNFEAYRSQIKVKLSVCEEKLQANCKNITNIRREYAKILEKKVYDHLIDLNFLDVTFQINFETLDIPKENGMDEICFMISTNPGEPLRPLQEVASGGELSRIMLAIKTVLADQEATNTLIFDEIDVGISGRTAQKVAEKLAVIAENHQVICITHLAQIAAMADSHFIIEKKAEENSTITSIHSLSAEESTMELARILGGSKITESIIQSAREMKELAAGTKKY